MNIVKRNYLGLQKKAAVTALSRALFNVAFYGFSGC